MSSSSKSQQQQQQQRPLFPSSGRELLLDLKRSVQATGRGGTTGTASSSSSASSSQNKIPVLPTYNSKLVQACFQDLHNSVQELNLAIRALDRSNFDDEKEDDGDDDNNNNDATKSTRAKGKSNFSMSSRPVILLHSESIERYKRCLLAYHYQRMEIIKEIQRLKSDDHDDDGGGYNEGGSGGGDHGGTTRTSEDVSVSANKHEVEFARAYARLRNDYSTNVFELNMPPPTSHMVQVRVLKDVGQVVLPESGRNVNLTKGACLFLERVDVQDFLRNGIVQLYDGEEIMDF
ncbi:DNA replication complex protein [Nitzschia inconspicua]|uniref:DNA replication complex protein n=1 Tax=Nitzschia inconspicua TaxID=303405 RepID=A0A9K3LVK9_9STRA|nr:DNA replication complex protein [Nitzschia inconspicua]